MWWERLEQHSVFYFERVKLKETAEKHNCCYTLSCLQCTSVHLDQRKQGLTSTGHESQNFQDFPQPLTLHTLDRTIKSLELVVSHSLEQSVGLEQGVW